MLKRFLFSAAALTIAGQAVAQVPRVIFSEIPTSPTSDVPGLAGAKFTLFDRPFSSPDGSHWAFVADTDLATTMDEIIIVSRPMSGPAVEAQEGTTLMGGLVGENWGLIDAQVYILNDGTWAAATNSDAATTMDEVIVRRNADLSWSVPAREGDSISAIAGASYGSGLVLGGVDVAGKVAVLATLIQGVPTTEDAACLRDDGGSVVAREGQPVPPLADLWGFFDTGDYRITPAGGHYIIQGDTNGATTDDDVLVYNGNVVLQENQIIPGSGFAEPIDLNGIVEPYLADNGDWYCRGTNDVTLQDWIVRNGSVVVATGDPVPGGLPGETFSDAPFAATFFLVVANENGDYCFGGTTSNADVEADAVIVYVPGGNYADAHVILRQGDGVDLDGNGAADDNVFIDVFNNDDAFITTDERFVFTADMYDNALVALGQALMEVDLGGGLLGDMNCDGVVSVGDIAGFVLALTDPAGYAASFPDCDINNADLNGDTFITVGDIGLFVALLTS